MGSFNSGVAQDTLTQGRISSTFNGAYEFSAFLLLILPIYLMLLLNKGKNKVKYAIMCLIILFCIYVTDSRSSLIISIFIVGIVFFKLAKKSIQQMIINISLILCILISFVFINPFKNIELSRFQTISFDGVKRIFEITWESKNFEKYVLYGSWYGDSRYTLNQIDSAGMDASLYLRISHWMQMIDGFLKYPILGLGVSISGSAADGNYIRILCESGILGTLAWIALLYYIYKSFDNRNMIDIIVKYGFISIVIGATLIDLFEASKVMMMFWFMLGIVYSYEQINKKEKEIKKDD